MLLVRLKQILTVVVASSRREYGCCTTSLADTISGVAGQDCRGCSYSGSDGSKYCSSSRVASYYHGGTASLAYSVRSHADKTC